jgi:[amino group carrier protein]-L-2-aminoadipate/L-glutamate 6-kinase
MTSLTVVKCGGALDPGPVCADVARLRADGQRVVVVHGGAPEIARLAAELGVPARTLVSPSGVTSRHTDLATLDVITLAMAGRAKPRLLRNLAAHGVRAVGLTGLDGGLLRARRKPAQRSVAGGRVVVVRDDYSGRVVDVATDVLHALLEGGFTPVVSPPAAGEDWQPLNVDADRAAAAIAGALRAGRLLLLTGVPGVLTDPADEGSVLARCALPADGAAPHAATGGMHRKIVAAREALRRGVPEVIIGDGRVTRPLTQASGTVMEVGA